MSDDLTPPTEAVVKAERLDYAGLPDLLRDPLTGNDISMVPLHDRLIRWRSRAWSEGFAAGWRGREVEVRASLSEKFDRTAAGFKDITHAYDGVIDSLRAALIEGSDPASPEPATEPRSLSEPLDVRTLDELARRLRGAPYHWNSTIVADLYAASRLATDPSAPEQTDE